MATPFQFLRPAKAISTRQCYLEKGCDWGAVSIHFGRDADANALRLQIVGKCRFSLL